MMGRWTQSTRHSRPHARRAGLHTYVDEIVLGPVRWLHRNVRYDLHHSYFVPHKKNDVNDSYVYEECRTEK